MISKKFLVMSSLVLTLGLSACSTTPTDETDTRVETKTIEPAEPATDKDDTKTDPVESVPEESDLKDNKTDRREEETVAKENTTQSRTEDISQYKEIKLTPTDAYNMFLEKKPGAKVEKLKLDYDNKIYYYKVEGYDDKNEYEIKLDALTGDIVRDETEARRDKDKEILLSQLDKIDELVSNALQDAADDFESLEWELEIDNGKAVLEIEVDRDSNDLEYKYDIETGTLLSKDN